MGVLYTTLMNPSGSGVVPVDESLVKESGGAGVIEIVNSGETVESGGVPLSVAVTLKFDVPEPQGVPTSVPVLFRFKHAGKDPLFGVNVNVSGGTPPITTIVWLYGMPFAPFGKLVVAPVAVKDGASTILIVTLAVELEFATDVAFSVTVSAAEIVGAT
jgi:hypothetical protein